MPTRWLLATVHLLALPIGFTAIWIRARALGGLGSADTSKAYQRVFMADGVWGLAALLWIGTGLLRAFAGYEKGTSYYLQNHLFWGKMSLLGAILLLELWPMATLIRWRIAAARKQPILPHAAPLMARISYIQAVLVLGMVFAATAMARGFGLRP